MHTTLESIESAAKALAEARLALLGRVQTLQQEIDDITASRLRPIKEAVRLAADAHDRLKGMVEGSRPLFDQPKTHVFHGIKVGWVKQKGGIEIEDPDRTVELIEKLFKGNGPLLARLIITKRSPSKEGIADLPVADAKKIGCTIVEAGDAVVVKPVDGAVDKVVKALLKDACGAEI